MMPCCTVQVRPDQYHSHTMVCKPADLATAETVLSGPLTRWMMHSDRSPMPAHLRKPDVSEAAWQTCATLSCTYSTCFQCQLAFERQHSA
jgi:hypothetical protein